MSIRRETERNQDATVYISNLDDQVTERILYELMMQAGPLASISLPKDRVLNKHKGFGFAEYKTEADATYAIAILNNIYLYQKPLRMRKANSDKVRSIDVGATLFVGNLDPLVDEAFLAETFGRFGKLVRVVRDQSKNYGFVSFDDFDASDAALSMDGQYLMNQPCRVNYAYKDGSSGERHGDEAERLLAKEAKKHMITGSNNVPVAAHARVNVR